MGRPFIPRSDCLFCGSKVKRHGKKFCSKQCFARNRVVPILERREHKECATCHCLFSARPAFLRRATYCSKECTDRAKRKIHTFLCTKCGQQKTLDDFYPHRNSHRGHVARCKSCYAESSKNVVAFKPYRRESAVKADAAKRRLPYDLTRDQFMSFWQKPCTYCGDLIPTIGLDRLDNSKGYEIGNVVPCCKVCNGMKSDKSLEEFMDRCTRISERYSSANSAITHGGKY